MINNATQLKAKVRNLSRGDDKIAKAYIRILKKPLPFPISYVYI